MEHTLRSCLIATRIADTLDLDQPERESIYWVTLLAMVGCTANSYEMRGLFGDDISMRAGMYRLGPSQMEMAGYFMSLAESEAGPEARDALMATEMRPVMQALVADCQIAGTFAERLAFGKEISAPLQQKFARWDGTGIPPGRAGEDIPLAARVLGLSWRIEAEHRVHGLDAALELARRHAGATLDPKLVAVLESSAPEILEGLDDDCWDAVVAAEPARPRLTGSDFDVALEALADFADLKSPWFTGHSREVAELAEAAGWRLGLSELEVTRVRRAALVHSVGRSGVPNTVWDKDRSLTIAERERMQLYPYFTDRILRRGSLTELAELASASQERADGSGYPRGLSGAAIPVPGRLLAAADAYQAMREHRPHRPPMSDTEAAKELRAGISAGWFDGQAAEAVLAASGHRPQRRPTAPADLTPREVEVLRLIARGLTSADAARELGIQPKTVGSHIEHIYAKIGASNRSVATLFAMQHGLV
jgi:HD-GYP domain-containing protein (c-di-GMP phosphodiesterase class II)